MVTKESQIAWAAGLFEGEGCFTHDLSPQANGSERLRLHCAISMTDHDILIRFQEIVGVGLVHPKPVLRDANRKPQWRWSTSKYSDFVTVFKLLEPWLGPRRTNRAYDLLYEWNCYQERIRVRAEMRKNRPLLKAS